jgi:3-isopropylmalate/(R)-2-methylmalate dehydratase large subunit
LILPGMITVCGDSHTSTHGAFGAYSLGIGTTEIEMVLATQCLILEKPKTFEIHVTGKRQAGVTAKDIVLHIIRQIGVGGGKGCVLLFTGNIFSEMTMEERMTVCNMSIEGGARAGLIEPDQTTVDYLRGRDHVPKEKDFDVAVKHWLALKSDSGSKADRLLEIHSEDIQPTVTWGTNPGQGIGIEEAIPAPSDWSDPSDEKAIERAISYMGVKPGQKLQDLAVDTVFIGSCTNARISDFEEVAKVVKGKKVKPGVRALVVPGSVAVRNEAERRGLHKIFEAAGFEWRGAGCSMCIAMNGDMLQPQQRAASTSNRNFEGRQGKGGRTHLCSPRVAATTALLGRFPTLKELQENYNGGGR